MNYTSIRSDRNRPRRVVFYGRVSTEHEAQISALGNQIQWYDDQAKYHPNWNVIGKYIDEGISGTQAKKRPAFLRMIEDAHDGQFDLIVTREVCRFARNTVDTLSYTRELRNANVEVYFVEDNIWTMDGDGELRLSLMATLAQDESRKISERVRAGQMISRKDGVIYGNGNILGYDRVGETYVINEEQAETVRMIFEMYVKGLGGRKIADELTRQHRLNSSGIVKWETANIMRIIRNASYLGRVVYNKSYSNNYLDQHRMLILDEDKYIVGEKKFEAIVDEELFERANRLRKSKKKIPELANGLNLPKHMAEHIYMFSGESVWAEIKTAPSMMWDLTDWFGTDFKIEKQTDEYIIVRLKCNYSALRYWALQFGPYVEILKPDNLRNQLRADAKALWEKYKE